MNELLTSVMGGANQIMRAQAINANNLANASTDGFKAELAHIIASNSEDGLRSSADLSVGVMRTTGRDLDISVDGEGWIAIITPDGTEAYSRRGDLQVNALGQLTDGARNPILGNNGPIALPPFASVQIGRDGSISIQPIGEDPNTLAVVDRIKLVLPEVSDLQRGDDGFLRLPGNQIAEPDAAVAVMAGTLEGSNVNAVEEMVRMIDLARQFEAHIQLMQSAKENANVLSKLLSMN